MYLKNQLRALKPSKSHYITVNKLKYASNYKTKYVNRAFFCWDSLKKVRTSLVLSGGEVTTYQFSIGNTICFSVKKKKH